MREGIDEDIKTGLFSGFQFIGVFGSCQFRESHYRKDTDIGLLVRSTLR